jgi:hypothetical protein
MAKAPCKRYIYRITHDNMNSYFIKNNRITLNKQGSRSYSKVSFPIRYGIYSEIETMTHLYQFNLNGEIKFIQARDKNWPRDEWLKRTAGNDWVYYTPGLYTGLHSYLGEYYLPCLPYISNSIFPYKPFENNSIPDAIASLDGLMYDISEILDQAPSPPIRNFLELVLSNNLETLELKGKRLHAILIGRITVLPPDSRHVDYDVIPVIIADGCLYNCDFCIVKDGKEFQPRSEVNIILQLEELREFYGKDAVNYNSLFLGLNDALYAGEDLIKLATIKALEAFNFDNSYMSGVNLFLFASVDSFLNTNDLLFKFLNRSPYYTYINIGFESADRETLDILKKPITVRDVYDAFSKMLEINKRYDKIEITANFVFSDTLPKNHIPSIIDLNNRLNGRLTGKGSIYLSPLSTLGTDVSLKKKFIEIKNAIQIPVYMYLIQRL